MSTSTDPESGATFRSYCPHCNKEVEIRLGVKVKSVSAGDGPEGTPRGQVRMDAMTDSQKAFLDTARSNGMLLAFQEAVANGPMAEHAPKNMEMFLLTVLRTAKQKVIPKSALHSLLSGFGGYDVGRLDFFSSNGVGIVTIDRRIRAFVPVQFVCGEAVTGVSGNIKFRAESAPDLLDNWVRTRMGYVPTGATEFIDAVRKRSIGDFANPVL